MKSKKEAKKVALHRETLRSLVQDDLGQVAGVATAGTCTGSGATWSAGTSWFGCDDPRPTCIT